MSEQISPACRLCRFAVPVVERDQQGRVVLSQNPRFTCHNGPPSPFPVASNQRGGVATMTIWPVMMPDDWCGAFVGRA
jgi:hypothetical protein